MFIGHFHRTAFIKGRVAQSIQRRAKNLKVVGSSPTLQEFRCFRRATDRSTGHFQVKSSMTFIRGNGCIERMVIWKKNGGDTSSLYMVV